MKARDNKVQTLRRLTVRYHVEQLQFTTETP